MLLTTSCMGRLCALFTSHTTKKSANGRIYSSGSQALTTTNQAARGEQVPSILQCKRPAATAAIYERAHALPAREYRPTQLNFGPPISDEPQLSRRSVIFALSILFAVFHVSAVAAESAATAVRDVQPLNVGDPIPDELWNMALEVVNHPEDRQTVTLNEYRGALLLLDFWATWCSSCIAQFPKLEKLQEEHADEFRVLLASDQKDTEVLPYFKKYEDRKNVRLNLATTVGAKGLQAYFPHQSVPHYVWVGANGTILAITGETEVSQAQFSQLLRNQVPNIPSKKDIDISRPLFMGGDLPIGQLQQYSVFVNGFYSGVGTGTNVRKTDDIVHGRYLSNYSIYVLYALTARELFRELDDTYNKARCIIEVGDTSSIEIRQSEPFNRDKYHTYELIVPVGMADSLNHIMLSELNRYTDYTGKIEKRKVRCLVIGKFGTTTEKPVETGNGQSLDALITHWNWVNDNGTKYYPEALPLIDESRFNGNLPEDVIRMSEKEQLNAALEPYGLQVTEAERELDMFVLSDKNQH